MQPAVGSAPKSAPAKPGRGDPISPHLLLNKIKFLFNKGGELDPPGAKTASGLMDKSHMRPEALFIKSPRNAYSAHFSRSTDATRSVSSRQAVSVSASTMTRTSGSVPDSRTRMRPVSPS